MAELDTIRSSIINGEGDVSVDVEIVGEVLKIFDEEQYVRCFENVCQRKKSQLY